MSGVFQNNVLCGMKKTQNYIIFMVGVFETCDITFLASLDAPEIVTERVSQR